MVESFASYAVQPTRDCRKSLERLPKRSQLPVKRVLTKLGKLVVENPDRVCRAVPGSSIVTPTPASRLPTVSTRSTRSCARTWVAVSLKRRLLIFISYSHKDREWLDTLKSFLALLKTDGNVRPWEDSQIMSGQKWRVAIDEALPARRSPVLLVTQDFIASPFIRDVELPQLLEHRANGRLEVHWIPVRPCTYHDMPLSELQALCDTKRAAGRND